jgi:hypothetical protein
MTGRRDIAMRGATRHADGRAVLAGQQLYRKTSGARVLRRVRMIETPPRIRRF